MAAIAFMLTVSFSAQAQLGGLINRTRKTTQSSSGKAAKEAQQVQKSAALTTDDKVYPTNTDAGVLINGVKWATRNVAQPGAFTTNPSQAGMFYQWNRNLAYNVTDIDIRKGWDSSLPTGDTWEKSNDPCPAGWRLPTYEEIQTLLDYTKVNHEWTTLNGVLGRRFTDKVTGASMFMPVAGERNKAGTLLDERQGHYWSSTKWNDLVAYYLSVHGGTAEWSTNTRTCALSIRAVAE